MGNNPSNTGQNTSNKSTNKAKQPTIYEQEYKKSFQTLKNIPNFFNTFLSESPRFGKNLQKLFPKALESFDQFFQMVMYLRKYDVSIKINKQAQQNSKNSTLLDRFFMICLGNISFSEYSKLQVSRQQIQNLLIDYFSIFIQKPKSKSIKKISKFIQMQQQLKGQISIKKFSQKFRQYFPHVQKFLKDYYFAKFHHTKDNYHILQQFNSKIIQQDAIILALKFCDVAKPQVTQLYNSQDFGIGLHTIQKKIIGYTGPWLLLISHTQKNIQGQKQTYIFGTYQNGPVKDVHIYQGDLTAFMFSIQPNIRFMTTDKGQGGANYFIINNLDQKVTKRRRGIGFGGTNQKDNYKLWIDQDMDKSKIFNGNDQTYGYGALASPGTTLLNIKRMEIWGLGSKENLNDQEEYWKQRMEEIMKRRKVNKKQFFDQNPSFFFENTFAHRQQVIGQIQKPQENKQKKQVKE